MLRYPQYSRWLPIYPKSGFCSSPALIYAQSYLCDLNFNLAAPFGWRVINRYTKLAAVSCLRGALESPRENLDPNIRLYDSATLLFLFSVRQKEGLSA